MGDEVLFAPTFEVLSSLKSGFLTLDKCKEERRLRYFKSVYKIVHKIYCRRSSIDPSSFPYNRPKSVVFYGPVFRRSGVLGRKTDIWGATGRDCRDHRQGSRS